MTTEEKLKCFLDITMKDAHTIGNSMVDEYKQSLDVLFNAHKEQALRQAESQIALESKKAMRDSNIELTRQQLHIKRKIMRKQSVLKDQLFDEVLQKINEFMKTEAYTSLLLKLIQNAQMYAGNQYIIIYIDPKDIDKKEYLEQETGSNLTISSYSFIGGIRTVVPYKNILIDDSFQKKIQDAKVKFVFGGSSNE